ncbi:Thiamine biosynthesis lipoprotein ApbE precursor [Shimia sp. SK013]|uniref:FAD:protein FMN transferase n=1 Tax=Shimia sp. SK013 TaxID=1389006 RepID=UPI0006B4B86F|nr:FAD:protein FMN transferase [Shimia sp. SK013]KPA20553.1 Thiamine biosynthesis lipoprotein ApbE precursor [Shimia sp. SK013]
MSHLNRRRFLAISACAAASGIGPANAAPAEWRGVALGAQSILKISGLPQAEAEGIFAEVKAELDRLENIFSLYRDSDLTRFNREGTLAVPAPELLEVLGQVDQLHRASGGAFDPTVQALWNAHATGSDVIKARAMVRWSDVSFDTQAVTFARPGMALTLNGIAQGAITDRIAALLSARGLNNVLIDMGEIAALGVRETGEPWRVGVITPDGGLVRKLTLTDRALATSAPDGFRLPDGVSHILQPHGGAPTRALVSIAAPSAALADGLSTAACLLTSADTEKMVAQFAGAEVISAV